MNKDEFVVKELKTKQKKRKQKVICHSNNMNKYKCAYCKQFTNQ